MSHGRVIVVAHGHLPSPAPSIKVLTVFVLKTRARDLKASAQVLIP